MKTRKSSKEAFRYFHSFSISCRHLSIISDTFSWVHINILTLFIDKESKKKRGTNNNWPNIRTTTAVKSDHLYGNMTLLCNCSHIFLKFYLNISPNIAFIAVRFFSSLCLVQLQQLPAYKNICTYISLIY